jgi:hypothetical protein
MPEPIDHRAEPEGGAIFTAQAQVHATLAAGTPVADRHVVEAAAEWLALRKAVLHYVNNVEDGEAFGALLELAGA